MRNLLAVILLMLVISGPAKAITFTNFSGHVFDLGDVELGASSTPHLVTVEWELSGGQLPQPGLYYNQSTIGPWFGERVATNTGCGGGPTVGGSCTWRFTFTPEALGASDLRLRVLAFQDGSEFSIRLSANGVPAPPAPVPIPAPLLLLSGALGALVLIGTRRRRLEQ